MSMLGFYLALGAALLFSLGPILWQLLSSLKPDRELTVIPPLLPQMLTAEHYVAIFTGYPFLTVIFNSIVVAAATALTAISVGAFAAFALAKLRIKGAALVLAIVLATSMFPPIATVSPLYIIINGLGLRDTLFALVLTYTSFSLPMAIWLLTNFFRMVPDDLYRAAIVDGCTSFQAFGKVILPLSVPGIVATSILIFIFCWNEFLFALTFTSTSASRTIPVAIAMFPGVHEIPWGEIAAATIVVIIPVVFVALLFQRRIVEGLTAGAVKG